jgi:hypothetical protein
MNFDLCNNPLKTQESITPTLMHSQFLEGFKCESKLKIAEE